MKATGPAGRDCCRAAAAARTPRRSGPAAARYWDRSPYRRRCRRNARLPPRIATAVTMAMTRAGRVAAGTSTPTAATAQATAKMTVMTAACVPDHCGQHARLRWRAQQQPCHGPPQDEPCQPGAAAKRTAVGDTGPGACAWDEARIRLAGAADARPSQMRTASSAYSTAAPGPPVSGLARPVKIPPRPSPSHHTDSDQAMVPARAARAVGRNSRPAARAS